LEVAIDPAVLTPDLVAALNAGPLTLPADQDVLATVRALGTTGGLNVTSSTARPSAAKETLA
jgi:hypothetical protein